MKTVKELKKELDKFPDDALCAAYEGEAVGITITYNEKYGFIHCSDSPYKDQATELLNNI